MMNISLVNSNPKKCHVMCKNSYLLHLAVYTNTTWMSSYYEMGKLCPAAN